MQNISVGSIESKTLQKYRYSIDESKEDMYCAYSHDCHLFFVVRLYSNLMRAFKTLNKIRKRYTYPQGFPGWLSLVPVEEIEDIIGMDAFNKLVVKFREEELGTYRTYSNKC